MPSHLKKFIGYFLREKCGVEDVRNLDVFESAFTHSSYKNQNPDCVDYERLEILGDAVITLIVTDRLYSGGMLLKEISSLRKELISGSSLSWISKRLEFDKYVMVDKGCKIRDSILEDVYEAFVGALHVSYGYDKARKFVENTLYEHYLSGELVPDIDFKTCLQEVMQSGCGRSVPVYDLVRTYKSEHGDEVFVVEVKMHGQLIGTGRGIRKKAAEQDAAKNALIKLDRARFNV